MPATVLLAQMPAEHSMDFDQNHNNGLSCREHLLMLEIFMFLQLNVSPQSPNGRHSATPAAA